MDKPIQYRGINHLAMITRDMDRTIRFWRDFLGMRLVAGLGKRNYRHYFFEISENDMSAFFEWPDVEVIPEKDHGVPVKGPLAFDHVSSAGESDEYLGVLREKFEAARMWVSEIIDHGFIPSIYAIDRNNIPIEFSAPVAHVDIRKKPRMMDQKPSKTALEGSDPVQGHWPLINGRADHIDKKVYPGEGRIFNDTPKGTD